MRISDWSSDVCSSDLARPPGRANRHQPHRRSGGSRELPNPDFFQCQATVLIGHAGRGKIFHQTVDNAVGRRIFNSMVDYKPDVPNSPHLDGVFQALSDPTRRAMLKALAGQPRTVGELAAPFELSLAGASTHIQVLERAGLIHPDREGRVQRWEDHRAGEAGVRTLGA